MYRMASIFFLFLLFIQKVRQKILVISSYFFYKKVRHLCSSLNRTRVKKVDYIFLLFIQKVRQKILYLLTFYSKSKAPVLEFEQNSGKKYYIFLLFIQKVVDLTSGVVVCNPYKRENFIL